MRIGYSEILICEIALLSSHLIPSHLKPRTRLRRIAILGIFRNFRRARSCDRQNVPSPSLGPALCKLGLG